MRENYNTVRLSQIEKKVKDIEKSLKELRKDEKKDHIVINRLERRITELNLLYIRLA